MKSFKLITIIILFCFVSCCTYAITQEKLIDYLAGAHDIDTCNYATQLAMENLEMLPNILIIPSGHPIARHNALAILSEARYAKMFSNDRFLSIMLNQIKNIRLYTSDDEVEFELKYIDSLISLMSYIPWQGSVCSLDENYSNANLIITKMKENDLIKNNGLKNSLAKKYENLKNSLAKKYENSLKSLKKGNKTPAINQLEAAKNEINAQSGKGIDTTAANILIRYTDNLIAHINSTN